MRIVKIRKFSDRLSDRRLVGCPLTKNRSPWCHAWCVPNQGVGYCGRLAPHGILGKTQRAILNHKARIEGHDLQS